MLKSEDETLFKELNSHGVTIDYLPPPFLNKHYKTIELALKIAVFFTSKINIICTS